jgi:hypothetical protein
LQVGGRTAVVSGYASVRAVSGDGNGAAVMFASSGDYQFHGTQAYSFLAGADTLSLAAGFRQVVANVGADGNNTADLEDTTNQGVVFGQGDLCTLAAPAGSLTVNGFDRVRATLGAGSIDLIDPRAINYVFEKLGGGQ